MTAQDHGKAAQVANHSVYHTAMIQLLRWAGQSIILHAIQRKDMGTSVCSSAPRTFGV